MVKSKHLIILTLFILVATAVLAKPAFAQRTYHINSETAKIWINQDGSIDLNNTLSLTLDVGDPINYVLIGQPNGDFTIGPAKDQYGHALVASDQSQGTTYQVRVNLNSPLTAGQTIEFTLLTNVGKMIYEDTTNSGNVGMKFIPTWWDEAPVIKLEVEIVLPIGVNSTAVKTTEELWNGTTQEDSRLGVYWQRLNLNPSKQYTFGVSFPKQYVQHYEPAASGLTLFLQQYGSAIALSTILFVFIGGVALVVRKKSYHLPTLSMESLGARRGLTAVEASYLLEMKPTMIVTEILYSLLQKRAVWVESKAPSLKLRTMPQFQNLKGPDEAPLRYYEIDFLSSIKADGTLDEAKLAKTINYLDKMVEEEMHGYSRTETEEYYGSIVKKAWTQVEQAGTTDLASKAYDEQLLWLLLDPNYQGRTQDAFKTKPFTPDPLWFWYWYGYQHYSPHPTYKPNPDIPTQAGRPPTIPGSDFANNIAASVTNTSNNIVANLDKFTKSIIPVAQSQKESHTPSSHDSRGACACAACACACACVSCACACAGGGVGMKRRDGDL
jgi:hypothetical protein